MADHSPDHDARNARVTPTTLCLIGLRGSGKSTLGRTLAECTHRSFIDLDQIVAARMGAPSAGDAIRSTSIEAFRIAEADALHAILDAAPGCVLALGGGTPTAEGAEALLRAQTAKSRVAIAYLRTSPMTLVSRVALQPDVDRPPLTDHGDPMEEIGELFMQRDPLYSSLASTTIECDGLDEELALGVLMDWASGQ